MRDSVKAQARQAPDLCLDSTTARLSRVRIEPARGGLARASRSAAAWPAGASPQRLVAPPPRGRTRPRGAPTAAGSRRRASTDGGRSDRRGGAAPSTSSRKPGRHHRVEAPREPLVQSRPLARGERSSSAAANRRAGWWSRAAAPRSAGRCCSTLRARAGSAGASLGVDARGSVAGPGRRAPRAAPASRAPPARASSCGAAAGQRLRQRREPVQQRAQVQHGPADQQRHAPPRVDLARCAPSASATKRPAE